MSLDIVGLVYVGGVSLLLYCVWFLAFLRTPWPLAEVALAAFLGWCCQIIATQLIVGWMGLLVWPWLLGLNALVSLGLGLYLRKRVSPQDISARWATVREAFAQVRRAPAALFLLCFLGIWLLWTIFLGLIFPPYSSDEHYYHMPIVASFVEQARIGLIETHIPWLQVYPKNSELMSVWASTLLHRDTFADLVMVPFWWAGALAVYAAARRLGATVPVAVLAISVFSFAPTVLIQLKTTYNDVMLAALWAIGFCFVVPPRDSRRYPAPFTTAALAGVASGLAFGTKYTGSLYVLGLAVLLLSYLHATQAFRRALPALLIYGGSAFVVTGYWYLSNWVHFGNPLWPFQVQIAGVQIFSGRFEVSSFVSGDFSFQVVGEVSLWERWLYAWFDRQNILTVDSRLSGFGPMWIVLGLPSVVLWFVIAVMRRDWYSCLIVEVCAGILLLTPTSWIPRYTQFLLVLGGVALAVAYQELGRWPRRWISTVTVLLALFAMVMSVNHTYFTVERIRRFAQYDEIQRTTTNFDPNTFGPTYQWVERELPAGTVLAYGGNVSRPFPLWGAFFQRQVISVVPADPSTYVDELLESKVQYVFIGTKGEQFEALEADPRAQVAFDGGDGWRVYTLQS